MLEMRKITYTTGIIQSTRLIRAVITTLLMLTAVSFAEESKSTHLDSVDVLIGTAVQGNTLVGSARPFSMVKPGPDTEMRRNYLDAKYITGFGQLHISGTGGNAQSAVLGVMPTTGKLVVNPRDYRSSFDVGEGLVDPAYYSITLKDYQVRTEITSTERVGLYRFTFPRSDEAHVLIDVSHAFNKFRGGEIRIVNNTTIEGTGKYNGYMGSDFDIAFSIEFSKPFVSSGVWKKNRILKGESHARQEGDHLLGAFVDFHTGAGEVVQMKVGLSYVDIDGARKNIQGELPGWDFEVIRRESERIWIDSLDMIKVSGGTKDQITTFYTAMYHTMLSPSILSDVDGRYEGFDGEIHQANGFTYYGEFSLWDTYRTVHPLFSLLHPQRQRDMVESLLAIAKDGGWLPKWGWSEGYTGGMLGDHAVPVILDAYAKGIRDFDLEKGYAAMRKNAMEKKEGVPWGRRGLKDYMTLGYAPEDTGYVESLVSDTLQYGPGGSKQYAYYPRVSGSASATLEFAYNDWCVAEMAKALGHSDDAAYFENRAYNYKNVYDPEVGFMRPRNSDGSWAMNPFVPTISGRHNQFYCEGNAWTYSWLVQHDVQGLINLMNGRDAFIEKLDEAFDGVETDEAYYDPTNEPDMHYPYLYNYAGAPWKSQKMVRLVTDKFFNSNRRTGLPGDDDVGTMSAWYIFSAMGFYPVVPGSTEYIIGSPLFDKVEVFLDDKYYGGKTIVIESVNNDSGNPYIQGVKLNGKPLNKTAVRHDDLVNNGHLVFDMGPAPNKNWAIGIDSVPTSMTGKEPEFTYSKLLAPKNSKADQLVDVSVTVTNTGGVGTAHTQLYLFDRNAHYRKGHLVGENRSVISSGETKVIHFRVPLYFHGEKTFRVKNLSATLTVDRIDAKSMIKK